MVISYTWLPGTYIEPSHLQCTGAEQVVHPPLDPLQRGHCIRGGGIRALGVKEPSSSPVQFTSETPLRKSLL